MTGSIKGDAHLRSIIFDLDGTLRHSRPAANQVFCDLAARHGLNDSPEMRRKSARWAHYYWGQSDELAADMRRFPEMDTSFWENYTRRNLDALDCAIDCVEDLAPEIYQAMRMEYQPEDWVPPEVPPTLSTLKSAGFRLAVLSNRRQPCEDHLSELGLLQFFDLTLVAGQVEVWKPDPQIFEHALERLEIEPFEALYVGDNYYTDVIGAQQAGLHVVLVDPEGIFPDAECPVIHTMAELPELLISLDGKNSDQDSR